MNTKQCAFLVLAVLLACAQLHLNAQVVTTTDDSGPGSLRQLVADASPGATITFDAGLSGQTIALTNGQILITNSITIDGSSLADRVIIDGAGNNRLFECGANTTNSFHSVTLTNGYTIADGGAILNQGVLTLDQCGLVGNSAGVLGGGVHNEGALILSSSTLSDNNASDGGALFNAGAATLLQTTVAENQAVVGAGLYNVGTLTAVSGTLSANTATAGGGGLVTSEH